MTQEEMNVAIAEHIGWTGCWTKPMKERYWQCSGVPETVRHGIPPSVGSCTFPNYSGDLNAMHEVEKSLLIPQRHECDRMAADRMIEYAERLNYCIDATATQRAEAFLRTVGKWKEAE